MASPSAEAGPSTGYIDDTPNFSPQSLDLISRIQERAWRRTLGEGKKSRRSRKSKSATHLGRGTYDSDGDDDDDVSSLASLDETASITTHSNSQSWPSDTYQESDDYDQEQQWREAMEQIDLAVRIVLCPLFGKYMGRQWALWAFSRYQNHGGLTMRFFGLNWVPETIVPSWLAIFSLSTGGA
ncbi:hypothetical protein BCV69DRAFT_281726 [Microstroma glucosiphilum]|uniref:Uncharacterized protein n=1 Tax=Pseudomicrostroma glucosiphilum TaxID=1684307 RepID=A0A316U996_9BASI|nr:hypothetical protein BCV69DRAFT_281726 [Pseudomicrostroma glucosiphilum]PWN21800.1 hypothetical protein BCV69DRAFT_281726 [Pseudomicrostroma glucosiphilum]